MKNSTPLDIFECEGFTKVSAEDCIKEFKRKRFFIEDVEVTLFKVDVEVYALSNTCPHQHTVLLFDRFIEDGCVISLLLGGCLI
jgi:nitrite reductase/ring-hydroxylating ferredoxin subunit